MAEKSKETKKTGVSEKKSDKLSYEQLEQVANNLSNKCQQLYRELYDAKAEIAHFDAMGLLMNILEHGEYFNSSFVERCAKKIETSVSNELDKADKLEQENNTQEA